MRFNQLLLILSATVILSSCGTLKKISYFQDVPFEEKESRTPSADGIRVRPEDKFSIIVNSKDPLLSNLFNLPVISRQFGTSSEYTNYPQGVSGYTVDKNGNIDFPVLGEIHVEGMNREEIAEYIKNELISQNLVKDPIVTVEYMNLTVSVLGEVTRPGRYEIDRDKISLLDALSMAGDLTIYGKRENVTVMRSDDGVQKTYRVNLRSAEQLYSSPVYYLQQNDVIYVEPNPTRARQSTVNGNNVRSTSFWLSLASLLTSVSVLIFR